MSVFLQAEWRNLILANYIFDPEILNKLVPAHTELDTFNGYHYISLVGFLFKNTRVKGIAFPFHHTFEEVNLRFYVKRKVNGEWRRGVVFIKEIVPRPMITFVANTLYKEHYCTRRMKYDWMEKEDKLHIYYSWGKRDPLENVIAVKAATTPIEMATGSGEEFITEHYYGYSRINENTTTEYKVEHPRWRVYPIKEYAVKCDFTKTYGSEFTMLNNLKPETVYLAEGSETKVLGKTIL
jgi:uncharacterized protein